MRPEGRFADSTAARPPAVVTLPHPIAVLAHDIRSAHNVGSVFRTADSAGLARVVLSGFSATPAHRGVAKTALGAQDAVAWTHAEDVHQAIAGLRAEGYTIAALERTDGARSIADVSSEQFPLALVLGNEVTGVPADVLAACDLAIGLPQYGTKQSLNVSVAFGIAAYGLVGRFRGMEA